MDREDYAYGQWKQKQIDEGLWKSRLGSAVPHDLRVQKYANHDPRPDLPFVDAEFPKMQKWEKVAWGVAIGVWLGYAVGLFGGVW